MAKPRSRYSHNGDPVRCQVIKTLEPVEWPWAAYYDDKRRVTRCVYVLHVPEIRRLKIGYTRRDVAQRVQAIRHSHPELAAFRFDVLGTINGGRAMERVIHERYADHRVSGEWFDDAILADVQGLIVDDGEWFGEFS